MAQLEFRCEKCGKLLQMHAEPGAQVTCSHCGQTITAPNVSPGLRPRPTPQVQPMNGARPQPTVSGQPGVAPPPLVVAGGPEQADSEDDSDSLLAAMSFLMPWALSIVFHIGLLLILLFVMTAGEQGKELEEIHVPSNVFSEDPGVKNPTKTEANEEMARLATPTNQVAPEVKEVKQSTEQPIVAISDSKSAVSSMSSAFKSDSTGDRGCKFFGTKVGGNTRKIVFIVDRSGSMVRNFDYVKAELKNSISQLGPMQEFTIIFFNDGTPVEMKVDGKLGMVRATPANIRAAQGWIDTIIAESKTGNTRPKAAIERAFQLLKDGKGKVQPSLVWILTDGLLLEDPDKVINTLNADKQAHINTIGFIDRVPEGERLMQKISQENGGSYKFVSEADLK